MARTLGDRLLRVSEATSKEATLWREGANLERVTGKTIDVLRLEAAVDRWRLADEFRIRADKFSRAKPARTRDAISRYYYSMYHAMRAAAYVFHGGDDHQEHRVLPGKTPPDFRMRRTGRIDSRTPVRYGIGPTMTLTRSRRHRGHASALVWNRTAGSSWLTRRVTW